VELYLYFPYMPSWVGQGELYPLVEYYRKIIMLEWE
jgi:hypothetical protein